MREGEIALPHTYTTFALKGNIHPFQLQQHSGYTADDRVVTMDTRAIHAEHEIRIGCYVKKYRQQVVRRSREEPTKGALVEAEINIETRRYLPFPLPKHPQYQLPT